MNCCTCEQPVPTHKKNEMNLSERVYYCAACDKLLTLKQMDEYFGSAAYEKQELSLSK